MPPDRGIAGSGPAQAWAQAAGPERRRLLVDLLRRLAASTLGAEPPRWTWTVRWADWGSTP